eukprot:TRINITY_DN15818_c0_g1_i3.p1 TRINITY_DN15818_c0_g1~~TRINITY_DN15818_c0_g1_i3.p1  ORF type:complete len:399 (+),score=129.76 TRINITY_DN15818_c0_g1_i3:2429-3625(+)
MSAVVPPTETPAGLELLPLSHKAQRFARLDQHGLCNLESDIWAAWPMLSPPIPSHTALADEAPLMGVGVPVPDTTACDSLEEILDLMHDQRARRFDPAIWEPEEVSLVHHQCIADLLRRRVWETGVVGELRTLNIPAIPPKHTFCWCTRRDVLEWSRPHRTDPCLATESRLQKQIYGEPQGLRNALAITAPCRHPWHDAWYQHPEDWGVDDMHWARHIYRSITPDFWGYGLDASTAVTLAVLAGAAACVAVGPEEFPVEASAEEALFCQFYYGAATPEEVDKELPSSFLRVGDRAAVTEEGSQRTVMRSFHDGFVGQSLWPWINGIPALAEAAQGGGLARLAAGAVVRVLSCPGTEPGSVAVVEEEEEGSAVEVCQGGRDAGRSRIFNVWPGDCLRLP